MNEVTLNALRQQQSDRQPVDVGTAAPSGYGSMYDQLFASNPYRNLTYKKGWLQRLGEAFGLRTSYDRRVEDAQMNAAEWDADVFAMMTENAYNSPEAKAERERAAGINPDLVGIADVSDSAGMRNDANGMQLTEDDELSKAASVVGGFVRGIFGAFTAGLSIYKDFLGIKEVQNVIDNGNITKAKSIVELVDETIVGSFSRYGFQGDSDEGTTADSQRNAWETGLIADADLLIPDGLSSGAQRDFRRYLSQRVKSIKNDAKIRQYYLDRAQALEGENRSLASGFIPAPSDYEGEVEDAFISTLASTARDIETKAASNKLASVNVEEGEIINRGTQSNIESQRLETLNDANFGAAVAQTEIAENRASLTLAEYQQIVSENKRKFYSAMQSLEKTGNPVARAVMTQMALQDLVQFEASGSLDFNLLKGLSSLVNGATGEFSEGLKKSNGFGLSGELKVRTK